MEKKEIIALCEEYLELEDVIYTKEHDKNYNFLEDDCNEILRQNEILKKLNIERDYELYCLESTNSIIKNMIIPILKLIT